MDQPAARSSPDVTVLGMLVVAAVGVLFCWLAGLAATVVEAADQPSLGAPTAVPSGHGLPPAPPNIPSPVEQFRRLIAMSPAERTEALMKKPEIQREYIQAKINEYQGLRPDERELRLRLVQLHWYLAPLLRMPSSNRADQLKGIPPPDRQIIQDRLAQWDRLGEETRAQILEHEPTMQYLIRFSASTAAERKAAQRSLPAPARLQLEERLRRWKEMSPGSQRKMLTYFQEFFDLPLKEKSRTLNVLSEAERTQMEETLLAFERLPAGQRRLCIESFHRFAAMSPAERAQFLKNAERWQAMTPTERDNWRKIVAQLPPLPPRYGEPPFPDVRGQRMPPSLPGSTLFSATNTAETQ
jgi:hypothetical protein